MPTTKGWVRDDVTWKSYRTNPGKEGYVDPKTGKRYTYSWVNNKKVFVPLEESRCPVSLLKLRDWLKAQIPDEEMANKGYSEAAGKMRAEKIFGQAGWFNPARFSEELMLIAGQEANHKWILEAMVDIITERCGK